MKKKKEKLKKSKQTVLEIVLNRDTAIKNLMNKPNPK